MLAEVGDRLCIHDPDSRYAVAAQLEPDVGYRFPVEEQIVIIYIASQGLLDGVAVDKIAEYSKEVLDRLKRKQGEAIKSIAVSGVMSDETAALIRNEAEDLTNVYSA